MKAINDLIGQIDKTMLSKKRKEEIKDSVCGILTNLVNLHINDITNIAPESDGKTNRLNQLKEILDTLNNF
jgi:hypothetical protein